MQGNVVEGTSPPASQSAELPGVTPEALFGGPSWVGERLDSGASTDPATHQQLPLAPPVLPIGSIFGKAPAQETWPL